MQLSRGATVAVADGEKFNLFRNDGDEAELNLVPVAHEAVDADHRAGAGRHGTSANPDGGQDAEDGFSTGIVDILNRQVLEGEISSLLVIAAPRTLGALRKHYHQKLSTILVGEIPKDLASHTIKDVEKAVSAA